MRAMVIAAGLMRTGRASDAQKSGGFIRLRATGGGFYFVAHDGVRVLRGDELDDAEELQQGFVAAMERAGSKA